MILFGVYRRAGLGGTWLPASKEKNDAPGPSSEDGRPRQACMQVPSAKNQVSVTWFRHNT